MERVGFFGGCFNPPTSIHIRIANKLIEQGKLDKIVFVPVNDYYKKENLAEAKHRYKMLCLATKNHEKLEVDDTLIMKNQKLFAVDSFKLISNRDFIKNNNKEIFFIMGSDNYNQMPEWKEYDKIKDKYKYIVIERNENEISSTQIREMIKNNDENVVNYLSKEVYNYIVENNLYKL